MGKVLLIIFIIAFVFAYFYFGYYQDYKRNPKDFLRTIIGMPVGLVSKMFGFSSFNQKIKDWTNGKK
ncbi:MAG: hypothetical protein JNM71_09145 [Flavobacterium lindanitolerans]|jgi:RsiW-degrading membrane proteinase PrsW (M82 family)|uniref:hypothetical protein n=1 Tax=Flavobacterium lindanitolerans TaxID=428988 RepID=UPI001A4648F5|nr:hypothetical protein [Flavobacterium lindanitolerans]MBL7868175.1 hypothetical protein [Flavobacterium lindanitolerans]